MRTGFCCSREKGNFDLLGGGGVPGGEIADVGLVDDEVVVLPQARFEQHADREREVIDLPDTRLGQFGQAEDGEFPPAGLEAGLNVEGMGGRHGRRAPERGRKGVGKRDENT